MLKTGQGRGIVAVFIPLGNGEPALAHQGQEVVFDLAGITGIVKTPGGFVGETGALVQFTEQQASASEVIRPGSKSAATSLEKRPSKMSCL